MVDYDEFGMFGENAAEPGIEGLWAKVGRIAAPTALWRGGAWSVVDEGGRG